jgi:hypothetical protein
VLHYGGTAIDHGPNPNLKNPPQALRGPVVALINKTLEHALNEIPAGYEMASGFGATHVYPMPVFKEAITNGGCTVTTAIRATWRSGCSIAGSRLKAPGENFCSTLVGLPSSPRAQRRAVPVWSRWRVCEIGRPRAGVSHYRKAPVTANTGG